MISLVISGGQSGADLGAWKTARACQIPTAGFMPARFLTEAGPKPEYATLYNAEEHSSPDYPARTAANVALATAVVLFGDPQSRGSRLTIRLADEAEIPLFKVPWDFKTPGELAEELRKWDHSRLLIAGNRESIAPGIGERVERFLTATFRALQAAQQEGDRP